VATGAAGTLVAPELVLKLDLVCFIFQVLSSNDAYI
jgi:hypothetical protein